jgi:diguanylate cyclase (GGDEF)-like protein
MDLHAVVGQILSQPDGAPSGDDHFLGLPESLIGIHLRPLRDQIEAHRTVLSRAAGHEVHAAVALLDLVASGRITTSPGGIDDYCILTKTALRDLLHAAAYDRLTGLFSRNLLEPRIRDEFRRAIRYRLPLSVLFIDVDDFKSINDRHGHAEGDRVLTFLGRYILDHLREVDFPVRYGGEEVVVVLPHTDGATGLLLAHRIHDGVGKAQEQAKFGQTVSLSIGDGTLIKGMKTEADLLDAADRAVYKAKIRKDMVWPVLNGGDQA